MAITGQDFWTQFLNLLEPGGRTSSVDYYLPNQSTGDTAQAGEWGNVITQLFNRTAPGSAERANAVALLDQAGFWAPTDDKSFWLNQDINSADIQDLVNAAEDRFPNMFNAQGASTNVGSSDGNINDSSPGTGPVGSVTDGGSITTPGFIGGGTLTRVTRQGQDDLWGMTFVVEGIQHLYTFDSYEAAESILGKNPVTQGSYGFMVLDESDVDDGDTWVLGDAAAFAGQSGSYTGYFADAMEEAALEAGVRNPGKLGEFYSQPEIQRIIAEGAQGDWSDARIQAEIRNTDYYQTTLYPGIKKFLDAGEPNPETAWRRYQADVDASLQALGYERDADGTYASKVGEMLDRGILSSDLNDFAPTFIRAEQSQEFGNVLSQWTQRDLGVTLDFDDWFDVLDGNTSPEIAQTIEKATLAYTASISNTTLDDTTITRLAELTNLSEDQMRLAFSQSEEALLSVGSENLQRYGLTQEALVNAAFGVSSEIVDPLSSDNRPLSAVEVQRRARKAATELGLQDDRKAQFFVGFTEAGRPERQGLAAAAPELG